MKKKMVTVLLTAAMVTAMAAGCGKSSDSGSDKKESYTIGIEQFAEHGSLDNCREGFLKGLEDEGIKEGDNLTVKYKNAAADMGTAKQISDSLVSDKVDLVCAMRGKCYRFFRCASGGRTVKNDPCHAAGCKEDWYHVHNKRSKLCISN